jgi:prepilin-type N-terminal cleavage/methylation domain-containing protein
MTKNTIPSGLTLVEMLVVLALLAAISGVVVSMTDNWDSRTRYEETSRRLNEIRSAILGPDAINADGAFFAGGYLQDTGELPAAEGDGLLRCPEHIRTKLGTELYQYHPTWKTWYGWHGPYLAPPPLRKDEEADAAKPYDGWGVNFRGWTVRGDGAYNVWSLGADGKDGGTGVFDRDFPDPLPTGANPLIRLSELKTPNLSGRLQVTVVNRTDTDYSAIRARFRIVVPDFSLADPFSGNSAADACFSTEFDLQVKPAPVNEAQTGQNRHTHVFTSNNPPLQVWLGRRLLFLVKPDGSPLDGVDAYVELSLSKRLSPNAATLYIKNRN